MTFVFGNCEIHCERRELHREGAVTHVEPQVFDVLTYLLLHRDRVVSKEELIGAVWDGRCISDDTLTSRVSAARRAIGDSGAEQRLIRTVTRRGFRFVGQVTEESKASATTHAVTSALRSFPRFGNTSPFARHRTACIWRWRRQVAACRW